MWGPIKDRLREGGKGVGREGGRREDWGRRGRRSSGDRRGRSGERRGEGRIGK